MIRLEMKHYNAILTEKQEKYQYYHQVKLVKKYYHLIKVE